MFGFATYYAIPPILDIIRPEYSGKIKAPVDISECKFIDPDLDGLDDDSRVIDCGDTKYVFSKDNEGNLSLKPYSE